MRRLIAVLIVFLLAGVSKADVFNLGAGLTSLDFVTVGNAGNAADDSTGYGVVDNVYAIGKYEVTAGQYTEFLNNVAATDTYGLYNTNMWSDAKGCKIQQSGPSGSYTYSVAADRANRPVNFVSFWDATRFGNWLHNGRGSGDTESGAYVNIGNQSTFARQADAMYWIPSENEWYKAAYHMNDGVTGNYFDFPTSSDTIDSSMANYGNSVSDTTDVGTYANASPYGTFDQGGNVWEWNETAITSSTRGLRGGYFGSSSSSFLQTSTRGGADPTGEYNYRGFRVASVPEPAEHHADVMRCVGWFAVVEETEDLSRIITSF